MFKDNMELYAGLLKTMDELNRPDASGLGWEEAVEGEEASHLRQTYNLDTVAGDGPELGQGLRLMAWLSAHARHDGHRIPPVADQPEVLLTWAMDGGPDRGINCRALAMILTAGCLSLGLHARMVYLMPCSAYDADNHVVTELWAPPHGWVMLDPSYNTAVYDEQGQPLGTLALRQALANLQPLQLSDDARHNGEPGLDRDDLLAYYAKDLFYLLCPRIAAITPSLATPSLYLAPVGYDVARATLASLRYRLAAWEQNLNRDSRDGVWLKRRIEFIGQRGVLYATPANFMAPPQ